MAVVLRLLHAMTSGDFVGVVVVQEDPDAKEFIVCDGEMHDRARSTLRVDLSIWDHHWGYVYYILGTGKSSVV